MRARLPTPASTTVKIAPKRPANIPLHTFSNSPRRTQRVPESPSDDEQLGLVDEKPRFESRRESQDSDSAGSEFSLWSDTGDLVDQVGDDPLGDRAADEEDIGLTSRKRGRRIKKTRFQLDEDSALAAKEGLRTANVPNKATDIPVPDPERKPLTRLEFLLACVMAPMNSKARIHGLYGKKLMHVFLFDLRSQVLTLRLDISQVYLYL